MQKSTISIDVHLDNNKVPENITWKATDSTADVEQDCKAMMLAFWDAKDKAAMRIDLWTKDMMVDEMSDFFYQTLMTMADTYKKATNNTEIVDGMKAYAKEFYKQFRDSQLKQNQ